MSLIERPISEYRAYSGECSAAGLNDAAYALLDAASTLEAQQAQIAELREALEEARLIVANLPHDESLFLAKIDAALNHIQGDGL